MERLEIKRLSDFVRKYRAIHNLTREQLAERSDGKISSSTIRDIELGKNSSGKEISPTMHTVMALAEAMTMTYEQLLMEIGVIPTHPNMYITQIDAKAFLKDINNILEKNQVRISYPIEDLTDVEIQEQAQKFIYLIDIMISKFKK